MHSIKGPRTTSGWISKYVTFLSFLGLCIVFTTSIFIWHCDWASRKLQGTSYGQQDRYYNSSCCFSCCCSSIYLVFKVNNIIYSYFHNLFLVQSVFRKRNIYYIDDKSLEALHNISKLRSSTITAKGMYTYI